MKNAKQVALLILDGFGIGERDPHINAIEKAEIPFISSLFQKYPNTTLKTSGLDVGLPAGQMGNSEVGHLNIGAGRVVYQQLALINKAFEDNILDTHPVLNQAFEYAKANNKNFHLVGLVSDGGVHASLEHLKGLCELANKKGIENLYIHAFTDGRDTDPKSGITYITELENALKKTTGKIATLIGRYYSMDRDKRWERVKLAYDLLVNGVGEKYKSATEAIAKSYENNATDEFIKPVVLVDENDKPLAKISEGDVVLFFNFRTDRGRQLTEALSQKEFPEYSMKPLDLYYITMTQYDQTFKDVKILFEEQNLSKTLGEIVENAGKKQLRIAETEKYPHVTFFFSGGREVEFQGEKRIMVPSPKVPTYDLQPEMSANEITEKVVAEINAKANDLIILNFANPDMVGHTGVFAAVVKALETIDNCTQKVVNACLENDYAVIIIADHGNADFMVNPNGSPNTAHTTNLVPCIILNAGENVNLHDGRLADVAPTILQLMEIEQPKEMTGKSLLG
ncbi:MAG: 2,3-bisphosphoglycerate-independent phosphoglycerate mutase [Sphingobacteriales bacterium]|nr:MAG: 2,3-bisphosphoglycerate-independent phosphoglycerate mutase [Sphingobacteriales bacterium]